MNKGILIVVSGFSGAGKGTLMKNIIKKYPDNYSLSISATTRLPREEDKEGVTYFFKTVDEFKEMILNNQFIEYATYVDNYYGTPSEYVNSRLNEGKDVILEIEIQGALKVKEKYPDALLLFITTPNANTLKERLVNRGSEDMETIQKRLKRAYEESEYAHLYDYLVINDNLEDCMENMHSIIQNQHFKADRQIEFIEDFKKQLMKFREEI